MYAPLVVTFENVRDTIQGSESPPEHTNQNFQVSDSSQIHGMTLKYSDDEITD